MMDCSTFSQGTELSLQTSEASGDQSLFKPCLVQILSESYNKDKMSTDKPHFLKQETGSFSHAFGLNFYSLWQDTYSWIANHT